MSLCTYWKPFITWVYRVQSAVGLVWWQRIYPKMHGILWVLWSREAEWRWNRSPIWGSKCLNWRVCTTHGLIHPYVFKQTSSQQILLCARTPMLHVKTLRPRLCGAWKGVYTNEKDCAHWNRYLAAKRHSHRTNASEPRLLRESNAAYWLCCRSISSPSRLSFWCQDLKVS